MLLTNNFLINFYKTNPSINAYKLYAIGRNAQGKLGLNIATNPVSSLTIVDSLLSWKSVSTASSDGDHTAAIRSDDRLFTWGRNSEGQLGDGTTTARSSPVMVGQSYWKSVVCGDYHTVAIARNDTLFAWGYNNLGQLGLNDQTHRSSPVQVGTSSWTAISAGGQLTAAIRLDGGLFTMGRNSEGQLGQGDTTARSSPTQVGTSSWVAVAAAYHTAAIRFGDRALFTWGLNDNNQLGLGDATNRSSPVQVGTLSWSAVSVNNSHSMAIRVGGSLYAWGRNSQGQLGLGDTSARNQPVRVGSLSWSAVSLGLNHSAGISSNTYYSWGNIVNIGVIANDSTANPSQILTSNTWLTAAVGTNISAAIRDDGKLFYWGDLSPFLSDFNEIDTTTSWSAISSGHFSRHSLALRSDGALFAWGYNNVGQIGDISTGTKSLPVQIGESSWTAISVGGEINSAAIRLGGSLFVWGRNNFGQLGLGDTTDRSSPVQVGTSSWTAVSMSDNHCVAVRSDGGLFTWGDDSQGQLGSGSSTGYHVSSPNQIGTSNWTSVSFAGRCAAAIRSDGALFTWGENDQGQLGIGALTPNAINSPIQIGTSSWSSVAAGEFHMAAIRTDGALFTWGLNNEGQLGHGDTTRRSSPVQVGTSSWTTVSASKGGNGTGATLAIRSDGALFSWGRNNEGQLGLGDTTARSSPVQVGTSSWTAVSIMIGSGALIPAYSAAGAIRLGGSLFTWGHVGSTGILGLNDTTSRSSPTQVGTSSWTAISVNTQNMLALRFGGSLFAWGVGDNGAIGDGASTTRSSPVQIGTSSWTVISAGANYNYAIRFGGSLFTWGKNNFGQLGLGDTTSRNSPVQVGTSSWTAISAGGWYSVGTGRTDADYLNGGLVFTFGRNSEGQLGDNTAFARASPVQVGTSSWTIIAGGAYSSFAIRTGGSLFAWGYNNQGQLGLGDTTVRSSPVQVGTSSWTAVDSNEETTFAIRFGGSLFAWGRNIENVFGDGSASRFSPVQVGTSSWSAVASGRSHTAAIRSDGRMFTAGTNVTFFALGRNTMFRSPVQLGTSSWTAVSIGIQHIAAIRTGGSLFTWGINTNGQLGLGDTTSRASPVQVGTSSWTSVSAGYYCTLAIRFGGSLFSWGSDSRGQLGTGGTGDRSSPVQVGTSNWNFVRTDQYADAVAAIRSDGRLFTWGNNYNGMLGLGDTADRNSPTQVGTSSWTAVACSLSGISDQGGMGAIRSDGALFTWGARNLGSADAARSSPVQVGTSSWVALAYANYAAWGIRVGGDLFTWGSNSPTQIGTSSWSFITAGAFREYTEGAVFGISTGRLFTWGAATTTSGAQLGRDTFTVVSTPTIISNKSSIQVGAGHSNTMFLATN